MMIRGPKAGGAVAVELAAATGAVTVREVIAASSGFEDRSILLSASPDENLLIGRL
jgi:hypothetical protein